MVKLLPFLCVSMLLVGCATAYQHAGLTGGCDPFSRNLERSKGMGDEGSLNL
jgi:hypothetical protein